MRSDDFCHRVTSQLRLSPCVMSASAGESSEALISAAVLFGVYDKSGESHLLLSERSPHLSHHAGEIALPGGKVEGDESHIQAALREAYEEVGLDSQKAEIIGTLGEYHTRSNYAIVPVISRLQDDIILTANPTEVSHIFSVPLSFLFNDDNHISREIDGRTIYSMPWQDVDGLDRVWHIWGVTAGIIRMVWSRTYGAENV